MTEPLPSAAPSRVGAAVKGALLGAGLVYGYLVLQCFGEGGNGALQLLCVAVPLGVPEQYPLVLGAGVLGLLGGLFVASASRRDGASPPPPHGAP